MALSEAPSCSFERPEVENPPHNGPFPGKVTRSLAHLAALPAKAFANPPHNRPLPGKPLPPRTKTGRPRPACAGRGLGEAVGPAGYIGSAVSAT